MWFPTRLLSFRARTVRPPQRAGKARPLRCEQLEPRAMLAGVVVGTAVAVDSWNNIYTTGFLEGAADFGPGAQEAWVATDGGRDGYLAKYDSGNTLQWVKRLRGAEFQVLYDVAVDADGSVFVAGKTQGAATLDGWAAPLDSLGYASVVAKIAALDGTVEWAHVFASQNDPAVIYGGTYSGARSIALDGQGSVYVDGMLKEVADFDPSGNEWLRTSEDGAAYVAKFDSATGAFQWAELLASTGTVGCYGGSDDVVNGGLAADASGVYTTGIFNGDLQFGGQSLPNQGGLDWDGFLAKLNADSTQAWVKQYTDRRVDSVAVDGGYVYTAVGVGSTNVGQAFVAKYDKTDPDATGGWYTPWEESGDPSVRKSNAVQDLQVQGGKLHLTGQFAGTVDFNLDSTAEFTLTAVGATDVFVWTMTDDGGFVQAAQVGGPSTPSDLNSGTGIAVNSQGNIVTTGVFQGGPVDFNPGGGTATLTTLGVLDAFLLKLGSDASYQGVVQLGSYDRAIDDGDPGYLEIGKGWKTGSTWGGYGGDWRYHAKGTGTNKAQWTFSGLAPGTYDVYATWVAKSNNATNAQYTINGSAAPLENQRLSPDDDGSWEWLGNPAADGNGKITVVLSDKANGVVVADAIRLVIHTPAGPVAPTTAASLSSSQASVSPEMLSAIDFWMSDLGNQSTKRKQSSKTALDLLLAGIDPLV